MPKKFKKVMEKMIKGEHFYCPLCGKRHHLSNYLQKVFEGDEKALWMANMVMHYRHNHITSWNKCWGYYGNYYRSKWFGDYHEEKAKVNERAKRLIIRKGKEFMLAHQIGPSTLQKLQGTTSDTMKVAHKLLKAS